jgi:RHS repeat-associated protein
MTDSSGDPVWKLEVRPFGDDGAVSGTANLHLRFPGQYFDDESGLNHNWNRDYSPLLGRYIQPDPLGLLLGMRWSRQKQNGRRDAIHLYDYAVSNPIRFTDQSGLLAAGYGAGFSGITTPPPPFMGVGGEALCYAVFDLKGNFGLLCCTAGGPFFGVGSNFHGGATSGGWQVGTIVCLTCDTICDMPGFFGQGMVMGAKGGGGTAAGGVSWGAGGLGLAFNSGQSAGDGAAAGAVFGGCWLPLGGGGCRKACEEP